MKHASVCEVMTYLKVLQHEICCISFLPCSFSLVTCIATSHNVPTSVTLHTVHTTLIAIQTCAVSRPLQVQTLLARERQLLDERRGLQTQLYRLQLQVEHGRWACHRCVAIRSQIKLPRSIKLHRSKMAHCQLCCSFPSSSRLKDSYIHFTCTRRNFAQRNLFSDDFTQYPVYPEIHSVQKVEVCEWPNYPHLKISTVLLPQEIDDVLADY